MRENPLFSFDLIQLSDAQPCYSPILISGFNDTNLAVAL